MFELGSISSGTLRTEDLLPDFIETLRSFRPDHPLVVEYDALPEDVSDGTLQGILDDAFYALQEFCPPYVYFGTHYGDPSDFGFWPDVDQLNEDLRYQRRDDNGDYIFEEDGIRVNISDHGNIEVYSLETGESLWSVV